MSNSNKASDLAEELLRLADHLESRDETGKWQTLREAAAEIENLQAKMEEVKQIFLLANQVANRQRDEARSDAAAMREAGRHWQWARNHGSHDDYETAVELLDNAIAALDQYGEGER